MGRNLKSYDERRGNDVQIIGGELRTGNMLAAGVEQEIDEVSDTQNYVLGTRKYLDGGERVFVYAHIRNFGVEIGRGQCAIAYNTAAVELGAFCGILTNGSKVIPWACVGAIAANQFAEGYIQIQDGFLLRIKSHPEGAALETINLTCYEKYTGTTVAAGNYGVLVENKYANVFSRSGGESHIPGLVVGVPTVYMLKNQYGWLQVKGPCSVISSQSDKGDADAEHAIVHGVSVGSEVVLQAAHGLQVIGHLLPMNVISWDNFNFMLVNLCIE